LPLADPPKRVSAVRGSPKINTSNYDHVLVGRVPGPDNVPVTTLCTQIPNGLTN
jgi:hypothetical protein